MLRLLTVLTVFLTTPAVSAAQSIEGVWQLVEREFRGGPNARIESGSQIQPSFLIYTEGYFMWSFLTGTEPRPFLGSSPADEALIDVVRHRKPITSVGDPEAIIMEVGRELFATRRLDPDTYVRALARLGKTNLVDRGPAFG